MRIKTLQMLSAKVDENTGEDVLNIAIPPFKISREARLLNIHYVTADQVMRPDLISFLYYGSDEYIDVILKANGISNPFCISEGMFLIIPDNMSVLSQYKPINKSTKPRTQFQNIKRITPIDKKRLKFLAEKSSTRNNGSSENLPPNMLKSDQVSKVFQGNNMILLGANMNTKDDTSITVRNT
jgi:hypothetical protein